MKKSTLHARLVKMNACKEAVAWVGSKSLPVAWKTCERGDWLLWFAARCGTDRKVLVRAACACARTALKYVPKGEDRPLEAIRTAEQWCDGKATEGECSNASAAASSVAYASAAYASYAASAASAASYAAYAASAASYAAYAASYAASAASAAYAASAASAANKRMAKIVRRIVSIPKTKKEGKG